MRDDGDFTAYAEARWPMLVRSVVLLGSPAPEAAEVAEAALARCRLAWRAIRDAGDIDVEVYAELLAERARALAQPRSDQVARPGRGPVDGVPDADPSDAAVLLESLLVALARLDPVARCAVVLRHGAGLSTLQAAEILQVEPFEVEQLLASSLAELPDGLVRQCR